MARYRRMDLGSPQCPGSEPVPRVVAVSAGRAAGPVGFVQVLVGVGVFLLHEGIVVSAVLGTGRQAVPALPSPLVVVILVGADEAAPLDGRVVGRVGAVPPALALRGPNKGSVNTPHPGGCPLSGLPSPSSSLGGLSSRPSPAAAGPPPLVPAAASSPC